MSSKGREKPPDKRENYPTPPHVADCMATLAAELRPPSPAIMEPSAGMGVVARAVLRRMGDPHLLDVVDPYDWPQLEDLVANDGVTWHRRDFLTTARPDASDRPGLIIGNPPFSMALEHITHALYVLDDRGYLVFLLPASFLQDGVRKALRDKHPPLIEVGLQQRPSFSKAAGRGGGTDSVRYSVFVWEREARPNVCGWPKVVASTGTPSNPEVDPMWARVGRALREARDHTPTAVVDLVS
jgi:hypothetical protein